MAGIAGILHSRASARAADDLGTMMQCLKREPFQVSGRFKNERIGLEVGWVTEPGTFSDCLPIWNEARNICLVFAGEEFTERQQLDGLRLKGHTFDAEKASYLVHLYEEQGPAFFADLNGAFSGVLADLRTQQAFLFNDRYGLSRIYFHELQGDFYFASEAKALLKILPGVRELDPKSVGEFFTCGCVLQNRTLFRGIALLPPGSAWNISPGEPLRKQSYFRPDRWEQRPVLGVEDFYDQFKQTWKRILPRYFRGQAAVALSLTGGVDSRMILAWAPRASGTLPCYTFGGRYRDCADVVVSRQVAAISGQQHKVLPVGAEFLSRFPALAEKAVYLSDGGMDVTGSVDLYLQELARKIAPVRVTGTNGGEILRRLVVFDPNFQCLDLLDPELARCGREAALTYAEELRGHRLTFAAFKQAPWYMGSKFGLERSDVTLRMPYFDNDVIALAYQAPPDMVANNDLSRQLIADGNPALARIATDRGGSNTSSAAAARARRLFQEFTFKAEYAYDYGMPQWLASVDHMFAPFHLEKLFLGRHKIHHFRVYYRDELSAYVKELLLDPRALGRPYLRNGSLVEIVNGHVRGNRNYTLEIHRLLTLELIQRKLIEQK